MAIAMAMAMAIAMAMAMAVAMAMAMAHGNGRNRNAGGWTSVTGGAFHEKVLQAIKRDAAIYFKLIFLTKISQKSSIFLLYFMIFHKKSVF